jgi:hypothetical protein
MTLYNRLKKQSPTWMNFKRLADHLTWVDKLGDTRVRRFCLVRRGGLRSASHTRQ